MSQEGMQEGSNVNKEKLAEAIESSLRVVKTTQPRSFVEKGRDLIQTFSELQDGNVTRIKYICGTRVETKPKIFFKSGDSLGIEKPDTQARKLKLSALLYTIEELLDIEAEVFYWDPTRKNDITTKHKQHAGWLQSKIDMLIENPAAEVLPQAEEKVELEKPKTYSISGIQIPKDVFDRFDEFDPEIRSEFHNLSGYSTPKRAISQTSLRRFMKDFKRTKDEVFYLNEVELANVGLDYNIDYGKVSYFEHMEAVWSLEDEIEELERRLS